MLVADGRVTIHVGDVVNVLPTLPDASVDCVVTSIPYYGLRDYDVPPTIWNANPRCDHVFGAEVVDRNKATPGQQGGSLEGRGAGQTRRFEKRSAFCQFCGGWRGQLGLEPHPAMFVAHVVQVFREVWRVLKPTGSVWINVGDTYASGGGAGQQGENGARHDRRHTQKGLHSTPKMQSVVGQIERHWPNRKPEGFKSKDRMLIPWRIVLGLADDGWWVRDEVIWAKPNPMPSSVQDRTTPAHEIIYRLQKNGRRKLLWRHRDTREWSHRLPPADYRWRGPKDERGEIPESTTAVKGWTRVNLWRGFDAYYDQDVMLEPFADNRNGRDYPTKDVSGWDTSGGDHRGLVGRYPQPNAPDKIKSPHGQGFTRRASERNVGGRLDGFTKPNDISPQREGRNRRSVWTITTTPFAEAHFATFPTALVEPMILATCPAWTCGCGNVLAATRVRSGTSTDAKMSTMQEGVRADSSEGSPKNILQQDVRRSVDSKTQGDEQGLHHIKQGLSADLQTKTSVRDKGGVRSRASAQDGEEAKASSEAERGSSSQEQEQARQQNQKPRVDDEEEARSPAETGAKDDQLSSLRRPNPHDPHCERCGATMTRGVCLDPFGGAGTTALVAARRGRQGWMVELNPEYADMAVRRIQDEWSGPEERERNRIARLAADLPPLPLFAEGDAE